MARYARIKESISVKLLCVMICFCALGCDRDRDVNSTLVQAPPNTDENINLKMRCKNIDTNKGAGGFPEFCNPRNVEVRITKQPEPTPESGRADAQAR